MFVCLCHGVTDKQIKQAVHQGASTVKHIAKELNVATQCGKCAQATKIIIDQELEHLASFYRVA